MITRVAGTAAHARARMRTSSIESESSGFATLPRLFKHAGASINEREDDDAECICIAALPQLSRN